MSAALALILLCASTKAFATASALARLERFSTTGATPSPYLSIVRIPFSKDASLILPSKISQLVPSPTLITLASVSNQIVPATFEACVPLIKVNFCLAIKIKN
jgi:hypothetical protein